MWGLIAAALMLIVLWCLLVAPERSEAALRAPFMQRTFAHRGLFDQDASVPENSIPAFRAACEAGYGVELDVQLTRDGEVVVFHDDSLKRACGQDARVDAYTFEELQAFSLFGTKERIPRFSEVLGELDGRVPVIVELKAGGDWRRLCELTLALLTSYEGAYCVESFHPRLVRWFYRHAPQILRGQLSEAYCFSHRGVKWYIAFMMSRLLTNWYTHPHFIAYRIGPKCLSVRLCARLGAMRVSWTARAGDDRAALMRHSDAIIFEQDRPPIRF